MLSMNVWRGVGEQLHSILTSAIDLRCGQLHAPATVLKKKSPLPSTL